MDFCPWLLSGVWIFLIALLLWYYNVLFHYFSSFYYFLICHMKLYENSAKKGQHLHNHCNLLFRSGRFLRYKSNLYVGCLPGLPDDLRIMCRHQIELLQCSNIQQGCQQRLGCGKEEAVWTGKTGVEVIQKLHYKSQQQVSLPSHCSPQALQYWPGSSWKPLASSGTAWCSFNPTPHPHCSL